MLLGDDEGDSYPSIDIKVVGSREEAHDVQCQHEQNCAEDDTCPEQYGRHVRWSSNSCG